jgi:hypothetical protein
MYMYEAAVRCKDIARAPVTNWEPQRVTLAAYCYAVRHGMRVQLITRVSHLQRYGVTVRGNVTSVDPPLQVRHLTGLFMSYWVIMGQLSNAWTFWNHCNLPTKKSNIYHISFQQVVMLKHQLERRWYNVYSLLHDISWFVIIHEVIKIPETSHTKPVIRHLIANHALIPSMGALYYGLCIFSSYDFHSVAIETKQTNLWRQKKDQAESQPRTLGKWQTGSDIISHSVTQSAFFYAVDTMFTRYTTTFLDS